MGAHHWWTIGVTLSAQISSLGGWRGSQEACLRPLLDGSKVLIAEWRLAGALDANKRLASSRVAAVATVGKPVEGGDKMGAVLPFNRLFKPHYPWINDGLDHLGDGNPSNVE